MFLILRPSPKRFVIHVCSNVCASFKQIAEIDANNTETWRTVGFACNISIYVSCMHTFSQENISVFSGAFL